MSAPAYQQAAYFAQPCPKCQAKVYDNRSNKRNPKAPDGKCSNRACDYVIWPPRQAAPQRAPAPQPATIGPEYGNLPGVPMEAAEQPATPGNERLHRIFKVQDVAFNHALKLAAIAEARGVTITLEGLSALTAQAVIQFHQRDGR